MDRFPRGTLPPSAFRAVATLAPKAIARPAAAVVVAPAEPVQSCDLTTTCPTCMIEMQPEHAHYKCPLCGYRDSCCF
jgi:Zn finger protein HypA/HybF involved in hydrogenase expression